MSEYDYAIGIYEERLKQLRSFVESIEVFQYYPDETEKNMNTEKARKYITQLESAIKRLKGE